MSIVVENFLNELIESSKENKLSKTMLECIRDLFLKYEMEKSGKSITEHIESNTEEENMKYYTMGWYIYTSMQNSESSELN